MAMKKTSGGDSPLRQGARKSFWTVPISSRRRRRIAMCFWKSDRVLRFFPSGGLYMRRGSVRSGPDLARFRLLFGPLEASLNIWMFSFCFVQFREYFLCNFSENIKIAENRELALWHLVNRLVPKNA
jgi:hypothetical protein